MTQRRSNPFDRFEFDPTSDLGAITDALRERTEEAHEPAEHDEIRAAWEALTLHPEARLLYALTAVPETRTPLGHAPPALPLGPAERAARDPAARDLSLLELVGPATLTDTLADEIGPASTDEQALWAPRSCPPIRR